MIPQRRRPHSTTRIRRAHVELRRSIERMTDQCPIDEVTRVVDRDAWEALESRGR